MITRTIQIDTEEHAKEFDKLLSKLAYVKPSNGSHKITLEEAALGLGRKATPEELIAFFTEDEEDLNLIPSDAVFKKYTT